MKEVCDLIFLSPDIAVKTFSPANSEVLDGETTFDVEFAMALTNPQNITLLQTGNVANG